MKVGLFSIFMAGLIITSGCVSQRGFPPVGGIANFDVVSPKLMRGAQPTTVGLIYLQQSGVKKVINLRQLNDIWPEEPLECKKLGIKYVNIPLPGLWHPTQIAVEQILSEIQKTDGPVFIHCQYGCDRTGTLVACNRIRFENWSNQDALKEAEFFGMASFEVSMKEFILHFK